MRAFPVALAVLAALLVACPRPFFERVPSGPGVLNGTWTGVARTQPAGDVSVAFAPAGGSFVSFGARGVTLRAADGSVSRYLEPRPPWPPGFPATASALPG